MKLIELISEDRKTLSLGRVAFWLIFGISIYYWLYKGIDIPGNLNSAFITILAYNLTTKAITAWAPQQENPIEGI